MRRWFALLLLLVTTLVHAAPHALIFIAAADSQGTAVRAIDLAKSEWVQWPADSGRRGDNQLLSIITGRNWRGEMVDLGFRELSGKGWQSGNGPNLESRGHFRARNQWLQDGQLYVYGPGPGFSPHLLLLALTDSPTPVKPLRPKDPLPQDGIILAEVRNWEDATALSRRIEGRTLVVEYPTEEGEHWSRYYTSRGPWPGQLTPTDPAVNIPGLIPASRLLALIKTPEQFRWEPDLSGRWGGANRWFLHEKEATPTILGVWFSLAVFVIATGLAQMMNEDRAPFVSELLIAVILSPAALVLGGAAAKFGDIQAWGLWLILAMFGLYGVTTIVGAILRRLIPGLHPLWAPALFGLITLMSSDPLWSDLTLRFGKGQYTVPPIALGTFVGYLTGTMAFAPVRWLGRLLAGIVLAYTIFGNPWWVGSEPTFILAPVVAILAAEGLLRPVVLLVLALLPSRVTWLWHHGVAWSPQGLITALEDASALNLWTHYQALSSPFVIATVALSLILMLLGNSFLVYRTKKLVRFDPRLKALPMAGFGLCLMCTTLAEAVISGLVVIYGAIIAIIYDGLRANA